jgi:Protein of unknown function (DUF3375)
VSVASQLDYQEIRYRLQHHAVFRLLRKERVAFILAFLISAFKTRQRSDIPESELITQLSSYIDMLRLTVGEADLTVDARASLEDWANDGILRRFYIPRDDEPRYDLTPEAERALEWMQGLTTRQFVGAESRLLKIFDILREVVFGASPDKEERIKELERRRAQLDLEIERLRSGLGAVMDSTRVKERYFELEDTARRLLADFKQIEQNFRELDRSVRAERLATERPRGSVLKDIFELRDAIMASDQGRSFAAFWAFLMSAEKQAELEGLVERLLTLADVQGIDRTYSLDLLKPHLVEAGARVQGITHRLNEDLRRFLDDQRIREVRRVGQLVEDVRRLALAARDNPPTDRIFIVIEGEPDLSLVMERPLYEPQAPVRINSMPGEIGDAEMDVEALFDQDQVDLVMLRERVTAALRDRSQVTLQEIVREHPLEGGIAELLGYLALAFRTGAASVDQERTTAIHVRNQRTGRELRVLAPTVIFLPEVRQ